ncbi:MAG: haloacid dehalogenase-like hydrolase [Lachnospiraceae bacterium]|nr:haloacid dehalogenase-like hydrolase [Lachnospiraceae bacterium]
MNNQNEQKPVVAIMYDFDKTLCTKDMQEYTFIPNIGMTAKAFWAEAAALAKDRQMDGVLTYMYLMLEKSRAAHKSIHREDFVALGKDLEFFPGVTDWFARIARFGEEIGVTVEHYIISSGLREIIEGSEVFRAFREVFACEFLYDENNIACWPKNAVNYTTKTQFLFRINKGVLDISNDTDLNTYTPEDERRVPFRNMIYIGDGLTDVPCMKLVKVNGGYSVAVYRDETLAKVQPLLTDNRVNFIEPADYREGSDLDTTVKNILRKMILTDDLVGRSAGQRKAAQEAAKPRRKKK